MLTNILRPFWIALALGIASMLPQVAHAQTVPTIIVTTSIQNAVNAGCNGAPGAWNVIIPAGATPTDSTGSVQGCLRTYITDNRITPPATCQWLSPHYLCNQGPQPPPTPGGNFDPTANQNITGAWTFALPLPVQSISTTQTSVNTFIAGRNASSGDIPQSCSNYLTNPILTLQGSQWVKCISASQLSPLASLSDIQAASPTAGSIAGLIQAQSGCTTAGNAWNPATNTCVASSGGGGAAYFVTVAANTSGIAANSVSAFGAAPYSFTVFTGGSQVGNPSAIGVYLPKACPVSHVAFDYYLTGGSPASTATWSIVGNVNSGGAGSNYYTSPTLTWNNYFPTHNDYAVTGTTIPAGTFVQFQLSNAGAIGGSAISATMFCGS